MSSLTVVPIETPTLGDRSYFVHDGEVAFVVDPQRDIDRVLALLDEHGVRLTHVFETHIHNDYVTGGFALAQRTGAQYLVNGEDAVSFDRTPLVDGQVVEVGGRMRVTALATPGHTFTHLSYVLTERQGGAGDGLDRSVGVFSGGSLLYGATGRPDLLGPDHTHDLVRHQHASAHRLADLLPDDADVYPTHGFGSFCSATQSEATSSTIGLERKLNPVLTQDEQTYVDELLAGLGPWPAYYAHMAPANAEGPSEPDLSPPSVADAAELRQRIEAGEWVVDLRNRTAFAAGHAPGTLNFGLDGGFATYLGWLVAWGTPITLLGETAKDVSVAQRELVRIGIDRPAAHATGKPEDLERPRAELVPEGHLRRPGRGAAPPRGGRPGRAPCRRARRHPHQRLRQHPAPRAAGPPGRRARGRGLGALCRRLPRLGRRLDARRRGALARRHRRLLRQRRAGRSPPCGARGVTLLLAVVAGALIGLSMGTLGGGGSILAVPVLVYALGQSPGQATTGSLVVVGVTSLVGAVAAYRTGNVLLARGVAFGVVATGGAIAGARASTAVPGTALLGSFAVLMLSVGTLLAVRQWRGRRPMGDGAQAPRPTLDDPIITFSPTFACQCPRALKVLITATIVGLLTGFLGVGGGFLVAPALLVALSMPMEYAAGTSLVVITLTSGVALLARAGSGVAPDWWPVVALTASAAVAAAVGAGVADRADTRRLSAAFTGLVLAVAAYTAFRALPALI